MVTTELLDRNAELEAVDNRPDDALSQEVEQFLDEARQTQAADRTQPRHWYYRTPCPGVRYYSF